MIRMIGFHHKDTKTQSHKTKDSFFLCVGFGVQRDVFDYRIHFPHGSKRLPGRDRDRFRISFGE
ncbi:MAG: hypothetical protein QOH41_3023 [Blastocatellia bacterium]|jgi:hypothetical protein|nr:hypothetical protein [Blastocatellia bacterium]